MGKPIVFDKNEVPLCPNGHGPMLMVKTVIPAGPSVPEARAHCLECRHTMIVSDERTFTRTCTGFPISNHQCHHH